MPPEEPKVMHPTTPARLADRAKALQKEIERLEESTPRLILPCGCKVEQFCSYGIVVKYCPRHSTFTYSPRGLTGDVFFFVTEDNQP